MPRLRFYLTPVTRTISPLPHVSRPGTLVRGLAMEAALIVTRSGRLEAEGAAEHPIVMTSARPEGMRSPGDWGGLAMLGRATINRPGGTDFLEGFPEAEDTTYGDAVAPNDRHDCGTLRYLRIEFAGFEFANNNKLNGLTLGGCGSSTVIENVQVHYGSDDGVEVLGGTVGLKRIVISRAQDDSLDWDLGWTGWAQYVVILQDEPRPLLDPDLYTGGDNGIEADSLSDTDPGSPRSRPRLYNFTMVGSRADGSRTRGMVLREGTSAAMRNFLVRDYPNGLELGGELRQLAEPPSPLRGCSARRRGGRPLLLGGARAGRNQLARGLDGVPGELSERVSCPGFDRNGQAFPMGEFLPR